MKALSFTQPKATLMAHGYYWHTYRHEPTDYRGPIAIHAPHGAMLANLLKIPKLVNFVGFKPLEFGCIVGVAKLIDVFPCLSEAAIALTPRDLDVEQFNIKGYAYQMIDARPLREPFYCKGAHGLWDIDESKFVF